MSRRYHHQQGGNYRRDSAPRNQSPPPSSYSKRDIAERTRVRKIRQVTSAADHAELEEHYSFLPKQEEKTWQDRMVRHYHSRLYKEFVLADLTRPGQVGMRWRTEKEVQRGKGSLTCGNKHCPSYAIQGENGSSTDETLVLLLRQYYLASNSAGDEGEELALLQKLPHGAGLHDYEVPFTYQEHGESKTELVKLRLCLRCAPLLFRTNDNSNGGIVALKARQARRTLDQSVASSDDEDDEVNEEASDLKRRCSSDSSASGTDSEEERRRHKKRKKKRRKEKKA